MKCVSIDDLPSPGSSEAAEVEPTGAPSLLMCTAPQVTIVTPSYNQARFLERTIRSVLLQGYANLEYIIVDGGSSDGSIDIIRRYEPFLAHWVSERDRGQSHAINKGWRYGRGEVIAWINSDDFYYPGAVLAAVGALEGDQSLGGCYGSCNVVDAQGQFESVFPRWEYSYLELLGDWGSKIPQPATFLRRSIVEEVGWLNECLHLAMDYDLWVRIGARRGFRHVESTLAAWRRHAECKTELQQGKRLILDAWTIYRELLRSGNLSAEESRCARRQLRRLGPAIAEGLLASEGVGSAVKAALRDMAQDPAQVSAYIKGACRLGRRLVSRRRGAVS